MFEDWLEIGALLAGIAIAFFVGAWLVMLLVDPATAGAYTISYVQSLAITALASLLLGGSKAGS